MKAGMLFCNSVRLVCLIIDEARRHVATYVNVEACLMNWHVGKRIKEDVLYNQRAEYGKQILKNLSAKLTERYGLGWGAEKLKHCVRSAYYTELPSKEVLSDRLQRAIAIAREHHIEEK